MDIFKGINRHGCATAVLLPPTGLRMSGVFVLDLYWGPLCFVQSLEDAWVERGLLHITAAICSCVHRRPAPTVLSTDVEQEAGS